MALEQLSRNCGCHSDPSIPRRRPRSRLLRVHTRSRAEEPCAFCRGWTQRATSRCLAPERGLIGYPDMAGLAEPVDAGEAGAEEADEEGGGKADDVEVIAFDALHEP